MVPCSSSPKWPRRWPKEEMLEQAALLGFVDVAAGRRGATVSPLVSSAISGSLAWPSIFAGSGGSVA